ncbi:MAG: VOC family protein [Thermoplasmata archaeon]
MPAKKKQEKPWVASVAVVVSDREAAKKWYTEKLGLTTIFDMDHWVTVGRKGKGGQLHLCQVSEAGEGVSLEPGPSGVLLLLPGDFRKECQRLEAAGVEFSQAPKKEDWGWGAAIRDPDGNEHFLMPES